MDKKKKEDKPRKPRVDTFPKAILLLVELHGMLCITASYILAFINQTPVENLSITIVGQIVSPLICYILGSVVSNVFEKNQLSFSTPLTAIQSGITPINSITPVTSIASVSDATPVTTTTSTVTEKEDNVIDTFEFGGMGGKGDD